MNRRNVVFLLVTVLGLVADQASKAWIVANVELHYGELPILPGLLSIVHAQNPGAAMGILRDFEYRHYVFFVFTMVAIGVILDLFRRLPKDDWFMATTLGLILSGAIGNGIDRVRQRYVTDFIRVYTEHPPLKSWLIENFGTYEWPSFNIADSALVVGVGMFVVHYLLIDETEPDVGEAPPTTSDEEASGDEASGGS